MTDHKEGEVNAEKTEDLSKLTAELLAIAEEESLNEIATQKMENTGQAFRDLSRKGISSLSQDNNLVEQLEASELSSLAKSARKDRKASISLSEFEKKYT